MSTAAPHGSPIAPASDRIARLVPAIGLSETRAEAAQRLCDAAQALLPARATMLLLGDGASVVRAACAGFTLQPPEGLPQALDGAGLAELDRWAARLDLGVMDCAWVRLDGQPLGALVLFGVAGPPLLEGDRDLLGSTAGYLLEQARTVEDLRRAYESQERTRDRVVRTERLRVLGEMALGIAHDFNNVLNAVLGQVGVMELLTSGRSGVPAPAPEPGRDLGRPLARLKEVALDGAATVRRLQEFSRQRRDQEFSELDLSELLHRTVDSLRAREPGLRIDLAIEPRLLLSGNRAELGDALVAVLDNAVEAGAHRLTVSLERHGDEARLLVSDDGCGMSREVRKRAFDPFFTTKGSGVSGLGLSVAYGIVRRHGGRIELESQPGKGARVRMRFTVVDRERREPVAAPRSPAADPGAVRILLVEDDADNREAMATLLGLGGHHVTAAPSGHDGLRQFQPDSFDVVLTDLGLPDMTGWEVARHVKELSSKTPVALITGWGLNLAQEEIERRGVDLLIKKPIEPRTFLSRLAALGLRPLAALGLK